MQHLSNHIRRVLYQILPLHVYFSILSQGYFIAFRLGFLKNNPLYAYPYFLKHFVKKDDVCLDIGANLGYFSVLLGDLVGKTGKVYAVEPVEPVRKVLHHNTRRYRQVEILPFALGATNQTIQLGNDSIRSKGFMSSGSHAVITQPNTDTDIRFSAEMRKGSEVFEGLKRLDFIKCDIEGYENIVLQELEPIILQHVPIILVETRGTNREELLSYFRERGYEGYVLDQGMLSPTTADDFYDMLLVPTSRQRRLSSYIRQPANGLSRSPVKS